MNKCIKLETQRLRLKRIEESTHDMRLELEGVQGKLRGQIENYLWEQLNKQLQEIELLKGGLQEIELRQGQLQEMEQEMEHKRRQLLKLQIKKLLLLHPIALLPEECIAEMGVVYRRMKKRNASPWEIRCRLTEEFATLLWGFVQVKIENMRLPLGNRAIDD